MIETLTDPRDRAIFSASPLVMVPRFGMLPELALGQRRYLGARDGVYLEARSQVLHVCLRVGAPIALPYGEVTQPTVSMSNGAPAQILIDRMRDLTRAAGAVEAAFCIVLDQSGQYALVEPPVLSATGGSVRYDDTAIDPARLVVDAHTHGHFAAEFSRTDDESDRARMGPHLSMVLAVRGAGVEYALRACCGDVLYPLSKGVLA